MVWYYLLFSFLQASLPWFLQRPSQLVKDWESPSWGTPGSLESCVWEDRSWSCHHCSWFTQLAAASPPLHHTLPDLACPEPSALPPWWDPSFITSPHTSPPAKEQGSFYLKGKLGKSNWIFFHFLNLYSSSWLLRNTWHNQFFLFQVLSYSISFIHSTDTKYICVRYMGNNGRIKT